MNTRTIAVKPKDWIGDQIAQAVVATCAERGLALWKVGVEMGHSIGWANMAVKDRRLNGLVELADHLGLDVEVKVVER